MFLAFKSYMDINLSKGENIMGKGRLENLNALITGGGRGIGLGIARRFAEEGANLFISGRSKGTLEEAAKELNKFGHKVFIHSADVSNPELVKGMVEHALKEFSTIDILLLTMPALECARSFGDYTLEEFDQIMKTNLYGTFLVTQGVLPGMIARKKGRIINIASTAGKWGSKNQSAYNASKHRHRWFNKMFRAGNGAARRYRKCHLPRCGRNGYDRNLILVEQSKYYGISKENFLPALLGQIPIRMGYSRVKVLQTLRFILPATNPLCMTCQSIAVCGGITMV
ncbi:MAG: SDR family oxidoreductase [Desulfobacterales bacterium]|nr:SDR family oxidoreductase [Desulfobacterales bacterium]